MYCIRVTQVYFSLEKQASPWGSPEVITPIQYTTAQDMFGCRHGRFSTQPDKMCLVVGIDGSVHNRTNLKKVTQAYFSQEKRGSPWGSLEVITPIQYTTAQDMFGCRHGRFSTQPDKICLGVGIDGSVHNRIELIVTQAYFSQEKRASPWSREGVLEVGTPIQYTTAQDMFRCRHRWFSTQPQ